MKESIKEYYLNQANDIQYQGIDKIGRNLIHKLMEKPFSKSHNSEKIIELGALFGNHRKFIIHDYKEYYETDLLMNQSIAALQETNLKVKRMKLDATNMNKINSETFDRLISTCLIVHLEDPENALTEWRRVVTKKGYLSIWVQLEPSLFIRTVQFLISRRKHKQFYDTHFNEHITYYTRVDHFIKKVFSKDDIQKAYFPFRFLPWNLNGTAIYTIRKNGS
jgi:ubiquinone/menaquinone biosynthesis C-methylase UbiE